ncbi:hypothetical protein HF086_004617, partial [Spodoptera exigua]
MFIDRKCVNTFADWINGRALEEIKSKERVILQLKREAARMAVIQQNEQ